MPKANIEDLPIKTLRPYARNARTHLRRERYRRSTSDSETASISFNMIAESWAAAASRAVFKCSRARFGCFCRRQSLAKSISSQPRVVLLS